MYVCHYELQILRSLARLACARVTITRATVIVSRATVAKVTAARAELRASTYLVASEVRSAATICGKTTFICIAGPGIAVAQTTVVCGRAAVARCRATGPKAGVIARGGRATCTVGGHTCAVATTRA